MAAGTRARGRAGLVAAVLGCLAAVLLAGSLGPVTFSGDAPLDRLRPATGSADADEAAEQGAVVDVAPRQAAGGEGIPPEVVLSMAAAIVAGALLVRSLVHARREDDDAQQDRDPDEAPAAGADPDDLAALAEAARRGLVDLDRAGGEGGDAVLACWVALEQAGRRLGSGPAWTDTPTDFARRLVTAAPGLDPAVLDDLRRTYSRVRYGSRGRTGTGSAHASPDDVRRARAALEHLLVVLAPGAAAGPPAARAQDRPRAAP